MLFVVTFVPRLSHKDIGLKHMYCWTCPLFLPIFLMSKNLLRRTKLVNVFSFEHFANKKVV